MVFFAEQPKIGQKTANGKHSYCWNDVNPSGMAIIPLKLLATRKKNYLQGNLWDVCYYVQDVHYTCDTYVQNVIIRGRCTMYMLDVESTSVRLMCICVNVVDARTYITNVLYYARDIRIQ